MNGSEKITIKCQVCGRRVDTSEEKIYKAIKDENSKETIKICEKDWKKNPEQYLENYSVIYRFYTGGENIEFAKLKGKCYKCKKNFLVKEVDFNEKNVLCYVCRSANKKSETVETNENPTKVEQQAIKEEITNHKPGGISGGTIALIIIFLLVGAGIAGGIVYYFWNKRKINK